LIIACTVILFGFERNKRNLTIKILNLVEERRETFNFFQTDEEIDRYLSLKNLILENKERITQHGTNSQMLFFNS
jgi:hypothetical protein